MASEVKQVSVERRLFRPTGDGWYRTGKGRHYVEFRIVHEKLLDVEVLQILISREDDTIKEFQGVELDKWLSMLRGNSEQEDTVQEGEESGSQAIQDEKGS